jgi:CBS domain containing-hemolysin-like protein
VLRALKTLSFQLSGAQLGITVTSLLVGFLIEPSLSPAIRSALDLVGVENATFGLSLAVALVLATSVEMVLAELIPKNLAIARPVPTALWTATPLRIVNAAARPFILFLNTSANATVRLMGIEPQEELAGAHSLEELQILIRSARESGGLREEEFSLLARSITFREKAADDALTPRVSVVALPKESTLLEMQRLALETGHSRFPVYDDAVDNIVGIAHVKDVYAIDIERRGAITIAEIMREPLIVPESKALPSLLAEMRGRREQMVVVVDEFGGTAGIITLEDLLEEIVGEIEDEYDRSSPPTSTPAPGVNVVSGMLHPDEVRERTGFEMPEGDYDTLAGFLLTLFDRIPKPGDQVAYDGWELKVTAMDGRRIDSVLLVAPPPTEEVEP